MPGPAAGRRKRRGFASLAVAAQALGCSATAPAPAPAPAEGSLALASGNGTVIRCRDPAAPARFPLAVGVKTNRFYHATRAVALWEAWGHLVGHGLIFVSDAPLLEAEEGGWSASTVVVEDAIDDARQAAYVPPWREGGEDPKKIDPFALPQLTRRVAALAEALLFCFAEAADWFAIVDDDTFVRPALLSASLLRLPSPEKEPQLLGVPTSSDRFTLAEHKEKYGSSMHCGGGSGVILSRSLLSGLGRILTACLDGPARTTLAWYWDEVELLGRCVYETYQLNCSEPAELQGSSEASNLGLMLGIRGQSELRELEAHVQKKLGGKWESLNIATLHPIPAEWMKRLGDLFGDSAAWSSGSFAESAEL
mmetsp:Transcript_10028/g.22471  ORF Transcript_10028/g.22471 Transcript_10028/m.22471 type:complete len:366 (-) Transcript_10028:6-1103(-)